VPLAPNITKLAEKAARLIRLSPDKSDLSKFRKIQEVVIGAGIGRAQQDRYFRDVQKKLSEFGVAKCKAKAARAREAAASAREAERGYP
jgi:hypothetical protein